MSNIAIATPHTLIPLAGKAAITILGATAGKELAGDGKGGIRDLLAQVGGGMLGLFLANKVL